MSQINTARDLEIKTSIQKLIREWYELKLARINFPFIHGHTNIPVFDMVFDDEELLMLSESCLDFTLAGGRFVRQFQVQLTKLFEVKKVILTISEQMAFYTAFQILTTPHLGSKALLPDDEIIMCPFVSSYIFEQSYLKPVYIDIEPDSCNIDVSLIRKAINSKSKAIIVSHAAGNPCQIGEIAEIAKNNDLWLIESCVDAIGSRFDNQYLGTFSDISIFGFGLKQQITTGEGGALFINNDILKNIGVPEFKMSEMQASIGLAQLRKLTYFIDARKRNFNMLFDYLRPFENLFKLLDIRDKSEPCWAYFPVIVKEQAGFDKSDLVKYLDNFNILTEPLFEPVNKCGKWISESYNFDYVIKNGFKIGLYPTISDDAIRYTVSKINEFIINFSKA